MGRISAIRGRGVVSPRRRLAPLHFWGEDKFVRKGDCPGLGAVS